MGLKNNVNNRVSFDYLSHSGINSSIIDIIIEQTVHKVRIFDKQWRIQDCGHKT